MQGLTTLVSTISAILSLDLLACQGKYQEKSKPPFSPGLEVSGEIVECNGCSSRQVGDRVYCIFSANGAFAEECVVDESRCFLVPQVRYHTDLLNCSIFPSMLLRLLELTSAQLP